MKNGRVLVVEDDPAIRSLVVELLADDGLSARQASDGEEAVSALEHEKPLAIVLDINLPFLEGTEVARVSRERYGRDVPIIVATANEHAEHNAREMGASGFVTKPFDANDLLSVLHRSLRGVESLDQSRNDVRDRRALDDDARRENRVELRRRITR